jgi:hypothetical protein
MNWFPRRVQIHLSTAVVLMFVAGGLIWVNVNGRLVEGRGFAFDDSEARGPVLLDLTESEFLALQQRARWVGNRFVQYGWPFDALQNRTEINIGSNGGMVVPPKPFPSVWHTGLIIQNALVALGILFAVWFFCEWLIRRRAARKDA